VGLAERGCIMAKLTLTDVGSGYQTAARQNANNDAIEAALENTLSRDGTVPNEMQAELDMDGFGILNVGPPTAGSSAVRLTDLLEGVVDITGLAAPTQVGNANRYLKTDGSVTSWSFVDLAISVVGNLAVARLNSGTGANNNTFWRGDGTWAARSNQPQPWPFVTLTDGATVTLNAQTGNNFIVTLGGNRTLSITNPSDGQQIELWVVQDGTGNRTLTWPGNVAFEVGAAPTLGTAPANRDRFQLTYNLARNEWFARTSIQSSTINLLSNEANVRLFERAGSPGGPVSVSVTVAAGVRIWSNNTATAALDTSGFASGSVINLINNGLIEAKGGRGGNGGSCGESPTNDTNCTYPGRQGRAGGIAILGPGAGRTLNITNANGRIWGGGGGGGGGGAGASEEGYAAGGGGGGGAGGGEGGAEGTAGISGTEANANPGGEGSVGLTGTFGAAGTGAAAGSGNGQSGGAGGDYGASGSAGTTGGAATVVITGGAGGAGGKSVEFNGGTVNFLSGSGSPNVKGTAS
jgi:hypothetical protein